MRNFHRIAQGMDVLNLAHELVRQPELWNARPWRTSYKGTPHVDVDDIWLRYSAPPDLADPSDISKVQNTASGTVWYPEARKLPAAKPLVLALMHAVGAWTLERLLVTRIRPGGRILPHADNQGTYVNSGDIGRYHIVVQGLPGSVFKCGEDVVQMLTGEAWWFNAHQVHEVLNNSADERIHLIADVKYWDSAPVAGGS